MGILSIFGRNKVKNEVPIISDEVLLKALINGETINRDMAKSIPAVAKNVDMICNTIAMIPIKLYKDNNGSVEEVKDTRVNLLNDDTKDTLTGVQFKKALVEDYLLGKGGYAYIRKSRNKVLSLHYVEDNKISFTTNTDPIFKKYDILVNGKTYKDFEYIKILRNTKDGSSGISVVNQVSKALETAYQELKYQFSILKSGGNKKGFLRSEHKLSQESIDALKTAWHNLYSDDSENKCIVLNDGLDFKESSNSSVEMQLNETKRGLKEDINDIFHIKDNFADTFKEAIQPIIAEIECSLNRDLLLESEKSNYFFAFDLKEILKGSLKERYEAYKIAKETGWLTPNEIRYLENYDKIDGLDIIAMSLGNVIYDIETKEYYTPNTDSSKSIGNGGDNSENEEQMLWVQKWGRTKLWFIHLWSINRW